MAGYYSRDPAPADRRRRAPLPWLPASRRPPASSSRTIRVRSALPAERTGSRADPDPSARRPAGPGFGQGKRRPRKEPARKETRAAEQPPRRALATSRFLLRRRRPALAHRADHRRRPQSRVHPAGPAAPGQVPGDRATFSMIGLRGRRLPRPWPWRASGPRATRSPTTAWSHIDLAVRSSTAIGSPTR